MSLTPSFETLQGIYRARLGSGAIATNGAFPDAPRGVLSADDFASQLILTAAKHDGRAAHPFLRNVAGGRYGAAQLREWVRQEYYGVLMSVRRHAVAASCAEDCDLLRALLAYVGGEADADPVGGAHFSLPQLWTKFGIALGLSREQITGASPSLALRQWHDESLAAAKRHTTVPVEMIVQSLLNPALYAVLAEGLRLQLSFPRDSFDYFWAIKANRWGEDIGIAILKSWCRNPAEQQRIWVSYGEQGTAEREWERLTILQETVEAVSTK